MSQNHAASLAFADVALGATFQCERTFTAEDLERYAEICGDFSPLHMDEGYASTTPFGGRVVHGMLLASLFSQLVGMQIPGRHALYLGQDLSFRLPVRVGERVRAIAKVNAKTDATRSIVLATEIRNAEDKIAVSGTAKVKVRSSETGRYAAAASAVMPVPGTSRKVALVTGGSRGIGAAVAQALATRGVAVAVNYYRNADRAERLVAGIRQAGGHAVALFADVRDREDAGRLIDATVKELGGLDMLVNGATAPLGHRSFLDLHWECFLEHLAYQVKAVVATCQAAYPHLKARGGGAVVNISSQAASGPPPTLMADYVTAKHALKGLSRALAVEWASDNIRVNTVSPGLMQTELTEHYPDRMFKMEAARTPLRRLALPADVANAIAYLLGEEGAFLTGVDIAVTGGQVML